MTEPFTFCGRHFHDGCARRRNLKARRFTRYLVSGTGTRSPPKVFPWRNPSIPGTAMKRKPQFTAAHALLDVRDLATILGRSPETIRKDLRRRPTAVPPRVLIPGTRQLRWRESDVATWLAKHAEGA